MPSPALWSRTIGPCLIVLSCLVPSQAQESRTTHQPLDTLPLEVIERNALPEPLVPGPPRHDSLLDYFAASNDELVYRFRHAREVYEQGASRPFRMITLVAGPAGVGKSFLKKQIFAESYPANQVCRFDVRELYRKWQEQGKVLDKPDLHSDGVVLNTLPALRDRNWPGLHEYLRDQQAAFYVIDSLDEVHPHDYVSILEQVERYAFNCEQPFVHIVVLGRGLAFRDYWRKKAGYYPSSQLNLYLLEPPAFTTTGDLRVSSWNFHGYFHKLAWKDEDAGPFTLEDYAAWEAEGFRREGRFRDVVTQPEDAVDPETEERLVKLAMAEPFAVGLLRNLAGNAILRKIIRQRVDAGLPFDQRAIKLAYLDAWLERDTKSDNRPSTAKPEHLDLYMGLLEEIAARYLAQGAVDARGFFVIQDDDLIETEYHGRQLSFPIYQVLNRSGLKFVDPRTPGSRKYRFEPIWLHRLLVELHNDRIRAAATERVVWVDDQARVRHGDATLTPAELTTLLSRTRTNAAEPVRLDIVVDHRCPFDRLVPVIKAAHEAGISDIRLQINGRPLAEPPAAETQAQR